MVSRFKIPNIGDSAFDSPSVLVSSVLLSIPRVHGLPDLQLHLTQVNGNDSNLDAGLALGWDPFYHTIRAASHNLNESMACK